jgi:hypothetical protein
MYNATRSAVTTLFEKAKVLGQALKHKLGAAFSLEMDVADIHLLVVGRVMQTVKDMKAMEPAKRDLMKLSLIALKRNVENIEPNDVNVTNHNRLLALMDRAIGKTDVEIRKSAEVLENVLSKASPHSTTGGGKASQGKIKGSKLAKMLLSIASFCVFVHLPLSAFDGCVTGVSKFSLNLCFINAGIFGAKGFFDCVVCVYRNAYALHVDDEEGVLKVGEVYSKKSYVWNCNPWTKRYYKTDPTAKNQNAKVAFSLDPFSWFKKSKTGQKESEKEDDDDDDDDDKYESPLEETPPPLNEK